MLFSIVTITKNNAAGFAKTETSLKKQNYTRYEWVIIDGDVEPDDGIYDAMNKGIERSRGDYVIFMNAGDTFAHCRVLTDIATIIGDARPDFIYGDAFEETDYGGPALKTARHYDHISSGMITHHQAMLYRRVAFGFLRYDTRYTIAADYKLTLQFIQNAHEYLYLNMPICCFESGGISQRHTAQGRLEQAAIRRELNICGHFQNWLIGSKQSFAVLLKQYFPRTYWYLRNTLRA